MLSACRLCVILAVAIFYPLNGVLTEDSASAAALSGVTALSESVSDFALSPIIPRNGFSFSYHSPFGQSELGTWGFHNAIRSGYWNLAGGLTMLNGDDYRWQDQYLSVALGSREVAIGYTQHLVYDRAGDGAGHYDWQSDAAFGFMGDIYGAEVRYIRMGSPDAQLHLTASTRMAGDVTFATDYVYCPHGKDSYRAASSYNIADVLMFQTSWQSEPARFGFGIRLNIAGANLMYSARTHPTLNLSHAIDIGFSW